MVGSVVLLVFTDRYVLMLFLSPVLNLKCERPVVGSVVLLVCVVSTYYIIPIRKYIINKCAGQKVGRSLIGVVWEVSPSVIKNVTEA